MKASLSKIHIIPSIIGASVFVVSVVSMPAWGLDCVPGSIRLDSQATVDNFQANHGPCDRITGDLRIENVADLTNLDGLGELRFIDGYFMLADNASLTDITALNGLQEIGGFLSIKYNPALENLTGLYVNRVRSLYIEHNESLASLLGMSPAISLGNVIISSNPRLADLSALIWQEIIPGSVHISDLPAITSLHDLQNLEFVGESLVITEMTGLADLQGTENLTAVGGSVDISYNPNLQNFTGLENLHSVGSSLQVIANPELTSLKGLSGLAGLGRLDIRRNASLIEIDGFEILQSLRGELSVYGNDSLERISGFPVLKRLGGFLGIDGNVALESISGFAELVYVGGIFDGGMRVADNPILGACHGFRKLLDGTDHDEPGPGTEDVPDVQGTVILERNAAGCNSIQEVLQSFPPLKINPGINDAWYNPATNGQGFLITVLPETQTMFIAWFTFDAERPQPGTPFGIGEPGHRWLTAQGPYSDHNATLTIYVSEGGVFDSMDPPATTDPAGDGSMTIEFSDCSNALLTYSITSAGLSGEIPLQRISEDNVALCNALADQ